MKLSETTIFVLATNSSSYDSDQGYQDEVDGGEDDRGLCKFGEIVLCSMAYDKITHKAFKIIPTSKTESHRELSGW